MFSEFDEHISEQEIVSAIKKLHSGRIGGPDRLLNEFSFMELVFYLSIYQIYLMLYLKVGIISLVGLTVI